VEAAAHWFLIEICNFNPTPDKVSWENVITILFRLTGCFVIFRITFMDIYSLEFLMYVLGAFFSHVLFFPPLLNKMRGKKLAYLGDAGFDKFLKLITYDHFFSRVFFLVVLELACIYYFYNVERIMNYHDY
jgi:hypothetical protein